MQGTLSRSLEQKVNSLPHAQAQVLEEFLGSTFPVPEKISDEFSRGVAFGEKRDRIWIKGLWLCNISRNTSEFQKKLKKIAQCKGITHLYVRDNEISRIPLEWMAFENLQVLDLRDNKLIYNPSSWLPGVSVLLEGNPVGIPNSSARPKYFSSRSEKALRTHRKNVCSSWKYHNKKVLIFKGFHSKFHHISRDFGGGDPVCCPVCGTVIFECTEDIGDNGSYLCPLCKKDICIVNTPYESRAFYIKDNKWSYIV